MNFFFYESFKFYSAMSGKIYHLPCLKIRFIKKLIVKANYQAAIDCCKLVQPKSTLLAPYSPFSKGIWRKRSYLLYQKLKMWNFFFQLTTFCRISPIYKRPNKLSFKFHSKFKYFLQNSVYFSRFYDKLNSAVALTVPKRSTIPK